MRYDILLAIKPKYAEMIYAGEKKYELRKKMPKLLYVDEGASFAHRNMRIKIFIYESSPVQRVTGYMVFGQIVCEDVDIIWDKHQESLGITRKEYIKYTKNQWWIYIARIANVVKFDEPYRLSHRPPQNFMYTDGDIYSQKKEVIENETAEIG